MSVDGSGAHNGRALERTTHSKVTESASAEVGARRFDVRAQVRHLNKAGDTGRLRNLGDTARALDMHLLEREVPASAAHVLRLVVAASQVVDGVRVAQTLVDLLVITQVPLERHDLAEVTEHTEVTLLVLVAVGHDDLRTTLRELAHDIAAEEAGRAKHRGNTARDRVAG